MMPDSIDSVFVRWAQGELNAEVTVARAAAAGTEDGGVVNVRDIELLRYAQRPADAVADLRIEGAIRRDVRLRQRYERLLDGLAMQASSVALAAATGDRVVRRIGAATLRLIESEGFSTLVIELPAAESVPAILDLTGSSDMVRIPLADPVDGLIQIPLDQSNRHFDRVMALLRDPQTAMRLL